jgi:proline iminopeptidase
MKPCESLICEYILAIAKSYCVEVSAASTSASAFRRVYWRHFAFLDDDELLRNAPLLNPIPGVLLHGRLDVSSPLETAWRLSRSWGSSDLRVIHDAGHGGSDEFSDGIVDALNEFRR